MKRMGAVALVVALALGACGSPDGDEGPVVGASGELIDGSGPDELATQYLGTVDGYRLYTRCDRGNRLYFWTTTYGGKVAAVADPTCTEGAE